MGAKGAEKPPPPLLVGPAGPTVPVWRMGQAAHRRCVLQTGNRSKTRYEGVRRRELMGRPWMEGMCP